MSTEPTNEAIRLACAEAMGFCRGHDGYMKAGWYKGREFFDDLPNYPEDDKAVRELRMSLTEEERIRFVAELMDLVGQFSAFKLLNSSPRDQAIAFLKVKGVEL